MCCLTGSGASCSYQQCESTALCVAGVKKGIQFKLGLCLGHVLGKTLKGGKQHHS